MPRWESNPLPSTILVLRRNFYSVTFSCWHLQNLVEVTRIELATSCLQSRRSPKWATPPNTWRPRKDLNLWHLVLETNVLPDWTTEPSHTVANVCIETHFRNVLGYARIFLCTKTQAIPEAAHLQFWVLQARVALHFDNDHWTLSWIHCQYSSVVIAVLLKKKNPGVFSSRVFELDTIVYYVKTPGLLEWLLLGDHRHVTRQMSDWTYSLVAMNRFVFS